MRFADKSRAFHTPSVHPGWRPLPRDTFNGQPDVLDAYDTQANLTQAYRKHRDDALNCRAKAPRAKAEYETAVREALGAGKDTSKVKNEEPELLAKVKAHEELASQAKREAVAHGYILGGLISEAAADRFGPADDALDQLAEQTRHALAGLTETWKAWANAWQIRRILSNVNLFGGRLDDYTDTPSLPAEVREALRVLEDHLADLQRLREDEAEVIAWRQKQADAERNNQRYLGRLSTTPKPADPSTAGAKR